MADKEPAGSKDEPTPADDRVGSPATPDDTEQSRPEPTNEELGRAGDLDGNGLDGTGPDDPGRNGTGPDDPDSSGNGNGASASDRQPVTVGASVAGAKSGKALAGRSDTESGDQGRDKDKGKGRATRKRDGAPAAKKRTGPVTFVRESVGELRKVVYPTGQQLVNYFVVVLVFVLFIIAYVSLLDLGFGWAMFQIFA